jgi:hypothetical protein
MYRQRHSTFELLPAPNCSTPKFYTSKVAVTNSLGLTIKTLAESRYLLRKDTGHRCVNAVDYAL